ncbi:MAG TPA: DUF3306 domain-containing protein [Burkholderiales bacterium]|nr:DUF3306 domain-containing protein [Burkholderiales bacterium]
MNDDNESFVHRWSRLKREGPEPGQPAAQEEEAPPLPSLDELTPESDFSAFMHPKVDPDLRQAALKKLFSSARYQAMDGLDVYIGDYSTPDPLPPALLAGLAHAQSLLGRNDAHAQNESAEREPRPAGEDLQAAVTDPLPPAEGVEGEGENNSGEKSSG